MPLPQHCIECDKVAVVLDGTVPYCPKCYSNRENQNGRLSFKRKPQENAGRNTSTQGGT